jgi:hypothetical protein
MTKGIYMTYSEVLFIIEEAAQRVWDVVEETTESLYIKAITATMEYWLVDAADIASYQNNPDVAYVPDNLRKSIDVQKNDLLQL